MAEVLATLNRRIVRSQLSIILMYSVGEWVVTE